ncbi:homoserine dehydrogenase [Cephaloticoccus primus]|uniref:Homoserine dehydrogenase n=1 Tax=Cephaloticoccus primus TaxID=1548207 RepID=A0A139SMV6_9BACT|nr:homoserine dehydrogenase [Cephaloticoccus primus]KXU35933.1 homoserine dehydrogenase [Cephaloticoccus primus]
MSNQDTDLPASPNAAINIGLCGFGTVGQGVWKHLKRDRAELAARLGVPLRIAAISVRDPQRPRAIKLPAKLLRADPLEVATDPAIPIVCELMGGTALARRVTLAALKAGKIVVSANKALICEHGAEIFATARKHGGHFFFEASVAGGVPIIKALREGLIANRFPQIYGILNGTCNYILTQMEERDAPYAEILAEAKALGYAEADEALDVQGWDAAHKAAVLAWLAHGLWVPPSRMIVEGIERVTPADFKNAAQLGYSIKLLAIITRDFSTEELSVKVHPALLPDSDVIASVNGVYNAISVTGDIVGTTLYIGKGAGQDATASAVISDIADAAALLRSGRCARLPSELAPLPSAAAAPSTVKLAPLERIEGRYYLRLTVRDEPGVLARIASVMARHAVSISSVLQTPSEFPDMASLVLTTHQANERAMRDTLRQLARLSIVSGAPLLLRICEFKT